MVRLNARLSSSWVGFLGLTSMLCCQCAATAGDESTRHDVDVDLVLVSGDTYETDPVSYGANVDKLLAAVAQSGKEHGVRAALLFPPAELTPARLGALKSALGETEVLGVGLALTSADGPIAAAIAGCPEELTDFPDAAPTSFAPVTCGLDFLALSGLTALEASHGWLWDIEPIQGVLESFFRPDARRVYVFLGNGDAKYLDAASFATLIAPQPQASKHVVASIAVVTAPSGQCTSWLAPSEHFAELASGGRLLDFCAGDWTPHAEFLGNLLATARAP